MQQLWSPARKNWGGSLALERAGRAKPFPGLEEQNRQRIEEVGVKSNRSVGNPNSYRLPP